MCARISIFHKRCIIYFQSTCNTLFYINKNCVFYYITLHVLSLSAIIRCCRLLLITLHTIKTIYKSHPILVSTVYINQVEDQPEKM
jgi:hypothetical protein